MIQNVKHLIYSLTKFFVLAEVQKILLCIFFFVSILSHLEHKKELCRFYFIVTDHLTIPKYMQDAHIHASKQLLMLSLMFPQLELQGRLLKVCSVPST